MGKRWLIWLTIAPLALACGDPDVGSYQGAAAVDGPWSIPAATIAIGDTQYVENTQAGPWIGEEGCGGSFLPGTALLETWIMTYFPQVTSIGGYSCRPINGNPDVMSVHATGRALDIFIPLDDGEADNGLGDPLANYLVEHTEQLGIQYIIWDRYSWNSSRDPGDKHRDYTGAHPHHDHLHVELSVEAANLGIPWYNGSMDPPEFPSCGTIPPEGGIVDDADPCARTYGPSEFWRVVEGQGYGGRLMWTDAFMSEDPSNWARYSFDFEAAGRYKLEYYSTPDYAVYDAVDYEIRHGEEVTRLSVDQAGLEGWITLGWFDFAAGNGGQSVNVYDTAGTTGSDRHIIFDAVRLTPDKGNRGDGSLLGGCSAGGQSTGLWLTGLLLLLGLRRVR